jgi:apolipoprotein N-acyltransferase
MQHMAPRNRIGTLSGNRRRGSPASGSRWPAVLGAAALGVVLALPWLASASMWPCAYLAAAGLTAVASGGSPRRALLLGWTAGFCMHAAGSFFVLDMIHRVGGIVWPLAVALFALYCAWFGLQIAIFATLGAYLAAHRRPHAATLAALWVGVETFWPLLFPWRLAQSQLDLLWLVQLAEWTGAAGISFLVMWAGALAWLLARDMFGPRDTRRPRAVRTASRLRHRRAARSAVAARGRQRSRGMLAWRAMPLTWPRRSVRIELWALGAALGLVLLLGALRVRQIESQLVAQPAVRLGLIQPDGTRSQWPDICRQRSLRVQHRVDLLVWPESCTSIYPLTLESLNSSAALAMGALRPLPQPACYLLCGADTYTEGPPQRQFVSALLVDPQERIVGRYHKRTLIPFGEYTPGEQWFPWLHRFCAMRAFLSPGDSTAPLEIPGQARLGVLMCYEDVLADNARQMVQHGADILVNLTNNNWFGRSRVPLQHRQLAWLRAIENRRYLVRCTTTGSTCVISPTGRLVAELPLFEPGTLRVEVHPLTIRTAYTAYGDLFGLLCTAWGIVALGRRWRSDRASRPEYPAGANDPPRPVAEGQHASP